MTGLLHTISGLGAIIILYCPLSAFAQDCPATLSNQLNRLITKSESVSIAGLGIDIALEETRRTRKLRLPTVNATAEARRERSTLSSTSSIDDTFTLQQLSLDQPIWSGGRIGRAVKSAQARVEIENAARYSRIDAVLINGSRLILELERARLSLLIRENLVASLKSQVEFIQTRFDLGQLTRTDLSQSEARLLEAQRGLTSEQFNLSNAELAYQSLFGNAPPNEGIDLRYDSNQISLLEAVAKALKQNSDILLAEAHVKAANAAIAEQKVQLRPQIDLSVAGRTFQDVTGVGDFEDFAVLGRVTVPLYDGGINRSRVKTATLEKQQNLLSRSLTQRQVVNNAEAAWRGLGISKQLEVLARQEVETAGQAHRAALEEQKLERRSTFEVLALEQRLLIANLANLEAKLDVTLSSLQLDAILGRLRDSIEQPGCR